MPTLISQNSAQPIKVSTGVDVTKTKHKVHDYIIVTDGTNPATLKIYKNDKTDAANQLWEDACIGANLTKSFSFSKPIAGQVSTDTLILVLSGTDAVAYVNTSPE